MTTEQTEAQDDKEVTPLYSAIITDMCDEIESLRAQLEAARGESKRTTDACAKYEVQLEQKMQEHQDALSEMRGRMEGAERDAARYRWLRVQYWDESPIACVASPKRAVKPGQDCPSLERLDAAIDAALSPPGEGAA